MNDRVPITQRAMRTAFVPYTPAAVRRIKAGAAARDLGWDSEMYRRVCREHGIAPCDMTTAIAPAPVVAAAPPRQPEIPTPAPAPAAAALDASFDHASGVVVHRCFTLRLRGPIQRNILRALFEAHAAGGDDFARGEWIAAHAGTSLESLSVVIQALRGHLRQIGLAVEGRCSRGGGYRLRAAR